jgi:hypothetical protein
LVAQTTTGAAGDFAFRVSQQGEYCLSVDAARGDDPSTEPVEGNPGILLAGRWTRPSPEGPPELASYSLAVVLGDERRGLDFGWDFLDVP